MYHAVDEPSFLAELEDLLGCTTGVTRDVFDSDPADRVVGDGLEELELALRKDSRHLIDEILEDEALEDRLLYSGGEVANDLPHGLRRVQMVVEDVVLTVELANELVNGMRYILDRLDHASDGSELLTNGELERRHLAVEHGRELQR